MLYTPTHNRISENPKFSLSHEKALFNQIENNSTIRRLIRPLSE
jgi:hypothetical protein